MFFYVSLRAITNIFITITITITSQLRASLPTGDIVKGQNVMVNEMIDDTAGTIQHVISTHRIWGSANTLLYMDCNNCSYKAPHSIDKLSNLADSRRYLRNALPPCRT